MALTPRTQIPYPASNERDWDATFVSMVNAIDTSLFAAREDRNILILGGGTMTFNATTSVLSWGADIQLLSPISGYITTLPSGSVTIPDNYYFYVRITRSPTSNITVSAQVGASVPNLVAGDDQVLIGYRKGTIVHFREGFLIGDGQSKIVFDNTTPGGSSNLGGDTIGPPGSNTVVALRNRPIAATAPSVNDVYSWNGSQWAPGAVSAPSGAGDWTGAITSNTVGKIQGATVPAAPGGGDVNKVFQVLGAAAYTFALLVNANVDAAAAIAGTKISPNFGSQNVVTTGSGSFASITTTGDILVGGNLTVNGTTTTVKSTVVDVEARIEHLNWAPIGSVPVPTLPTGIEVERGDTGVTRRDAAAVLWDESNQLWQFALQTSANDTAVGATLAIKALGATLTGLAGGGAGYATVSNAGTLGFIAASSFIAPGVTPGTAGQIYITNATPASAWTSLISVELTHGNFTAGGSGSDFFTRIGALTGQETSYGAMWMLGAGTTPSAFNPIMYSDGVNTYINTPSGLGSVGLTVHGSSYLAYWSQLLSRMFVGGTTSAAPFIVDWATANQTQIFSGTSATSFLVANTNGFASIIVQPGSAGVIFNNPTGSATVATIETAHGRITAGGGGTDRLAIIGPSAGAETSSASLYLLPNATAPTGANFQMQSDGTSYVSINAPGGGYTKFLVSASIYGAISSNSGVIGALWLGNIVPSGTNYTIQSDGATVTTLGAGTPVVQFASGTQDGFALGTHFAPTGHIRLTERWEVTAQNAANTATFRIIALDGADNMTIGGGGVATPAGLTISTGSSGLIGVSSGLIAWEAGADQYLDQTALHLRSAGHVEALTITPASTTSVVFTENASSGALIGYAPRTSNNPTSDLKIQGQYAFGTATLTNRTPGNVVLDYGFPTSSSNSEAYVKITRNNVFMWAAGANASAPLSQAMMWLGPGVTPVSANCVMVSDGASFTYMNTPNGGALGWVLNDASFVLYGTVSNVYYGGTSTAAPLYVDWGAPAAPKLLSGTAGTSLTVGTNNASAVHNLSADANVLNMGLSKSAVATNKVDFYSPNGTSQFNITVTDGNIISLSTINTGFFSITAGPYAELLFNTNQATLFSNTQLFENYAANEVYMQLSTGAAAFNGSGATAPLTIGWSTSTTPTILSGSAATSLKVGTNKTGASLKLQGGTDAIVSLVKSTVYGTGPALIPDASTYSVFSVVAPAISGGIVALVSDQVDGAIDFVVNAHLTLEITDKIVTNREWLTFNTATTAPTSGNGGPILYGGTDAGGNVVLYGMGVLGTRVTLVPADLTGFEGHCPSCGTDFAHEWHNDKYGSLTVCMKCLTDEIGDRPWIVRKGAV
jgi:hypothetical protein